MASFLQSDAWMRFQQSYGYTVERFGSLAFIKKSTPFGPYWISSRCACQDMSVLPNQDAIFLRLEPEGQESYTALAAYARKHRRRLVPQLAVQPRQTLLLDISRPDQEILATMHYKHRYNQRVAAKHGITVEQHSQGLAGQPFERFWSLLEVTSKRQNFRIHPKRYYEDMLKTLEPEGMVRLHFAMKDNVDLATLMLITYGDTAIYLHGASSDECRQCKAAYALHWETIQAAKAIGCTTYDLWGTDARQDPETGKWEAKEGARSYGTTRFKLGFGGTIHEYPGTFDLVLRPFRYSMYTNARRLRGNGHRAFS